jgi:2-polyprenyl-6-methoxyphenol hydroxylase-like FAD-dependent oxidoreductase
VADAVHQPDAASEHTVNEGGYAVRKREYHRNHDHGLNEEAKARQPQFDAVPPVQEAGHPHSVDEPLARRADSVDEPLARRADSVDEPLTRRADTAACQNECVPAADSTTCVIAGGGPAGMVLGLLLARGGVPVVVMEKHADFLRDFRGDTVHASTLRLLDELGLGQEFAQMPHREIDNLRMQFQELPIGITLNRLPGRHKYIALAPQWDFLELLATAAEIEPTFTLMRNTEVIGPLVHNGRVTGVRYRDTDGAEHEMRAALTVACDGRSSTLRSSMGLRPRSFGAPMDVWWFRLPRRQDDPVGLNGMFRSGHACIVIDRGEYYQIAYVIPKGADSAMRAEGVQALHRQMVQLVPWLADRVSELASMDDVKLLDVQLNRLRRWYTDGLLLIGDAAHAMSPVGGVGINLAVADAVAAATAVAGPLRAGHVSRTRLARVQARRWLPTALIQSVQRLIHDRLIATAISENPDQPMAAPLPVRLLNRFPALGAVVGYAIAIGPLPEHAPAFARR